MTVVVLEHWKGKKYISQYKFSNKSVMRDFIKLCKDQGCIVHVISNKKKAN